MYRNRSTPIDRELLVALFRFVPPELVLRYHRVARGWINDCCGERSLAQIIESAEQLYSSWDCSEEGKRVLNLYYREIHIVRSLIELEPVLNDAYSPDRLHSEITDHHLLPWINKLDGFVWPLLIARNYLEFHNGLYWVAFEHGLRWRKLTLDIPQDILVCAYHAFNDISTSNIYQDLPALDWPVHLPIYHSLIWGELDRAAIENKLADNHLHYIAGPDTFYPAWISLMNRPSNRLNDLKVTGLLMANLQGSTIYEPGISLTDWNYRLTVAAAIRLTFFLKINQAIDINSLKKFVNISIENVKSSKIACKEATNEMIKSIKNIRISTEAFKVRGSVEIQSILRFKRSIFVILLTKAYSEIVKLKETEIALKVAESELHLAQATDELLKRICTDCSHTNELNLPSLQAELQNIIDLLHNTEDILKTTESANAEPIDYALSNSLFPNQPITGEELLAVGERNLLVKAFTAIYMNEEWIQPYKNLFLLYLQILTQFKAELVQSNGKVGFENFFDYQDRKEALLSSTPYLQKLRKGLWLHSRLLGKHKQILKLNHQNIRIAPGKVFSKAMQVASNDIDIALRFGKDAAKQASQDLSDLANGSVNETKSEILRKLGITVHFIKKRDSLKEYSIKYPKLEGCRHSLLRDEVKKQAQNIATWLRYSDDEDIKLWRGPDAASNELYCRIEVFAQAMRFLRNQKPNRFYSQEKVRQPKVYSHCGEEFLDILDGLRYIDECIRFQELKSGDPLGHALALGIDPGYFYQKKRNRLDLPAQVYLDNIVWAIANIPRLNISISVGLQSKLVQEFQRLASEIYTNPNQSAEIHYQAWKLRGDNPKIYEDLDTVSIELSKTQMYSPEDWEYYSQYKLGEEDNYIRENKEVQSLLNLYHYDRRVREKGQRIEHIKVDGEIVELVTKLQKAMNKRVAKLGLVIEALPSVNLSISPIDKFEKHPVFKFAPITVGSRAEIDFEQHVSINTDNPGVCNISIENELMLLYLSMQKQKDEEGNRKYSDSEILNWLNKRISQAHEQNYRAF